MGWTWYMANYYKNGKVDRKAEMDKFYTQKEEDRTWDGKIHHVPSITVLKSSMVGTVYYAALEIKNTKENRRSVVAAIALTSTSSKSDYCNFGYKDMDETYGPFECDCPKGILDLLTPTDNECAQAWRQRCRESLQLKKTGKTLGQLPIGSKIRFKSYGEEVTLIKRPPAYQFKTCWWQKVNSNTYYPKRSIPKEFEIL